MAAFMGSPNLVLNHLILKDRRRIQQTAVVGKTNVTRSLAFLCDLCGCSLRSLRLRAFDFAGGVTIKNGRVFPCRDSKIVRYFPRFTAFFNSAPGLNFATRRAAILIVAPVCGLRPLRAFLCETENVPNPIRATRSPFFNALVMLSTLVSMALAAWVLLMPAPAAMRSIKSALFIVAPGEGFLLFSKRHCRSQSFAVWRRTLVCGGNLPQLFSARFPRLSTVEIRARCRL